jgi:hexosaminidase
MKIKKNNHVKFYIYVLFGMVISLTLLITVRQLTPAGLALIYPNTAPQIIPSLREWHGGTGSFTLGMASRIDVDPAFSVQLQETAHVFQGDLFDETGHPLRVVTSSAPAAGDFFLTLKNRDSGIGNEGYLFQVGDSVVISAHTSAGIFYGTRTALQILLQDPTRIHIGKGMARDYPKYKVRGFMLDVGRKFFSIGALEDYVKIMSWYKMNVFHLHLNDNEIDAGKDPDWMHKYAAFRLNSDRFKGLAAKDGSYTRNDMRELQDVARQHAVTIMPEIDAPAHALALTQFRSDLASQKYSKEFLNLDIPSTYTFMNALWDEFLPWFDTTQVHIGADEYALSDADKYRQFINTYDLYLKSKGKTTEMWGSLTKMSSSVAVNKDIVIDVWDNQWANPVEMVKQGFQVVNVSDNLLYIVPKAGYFHDYLDTKLLYEKWEPYIFNLSDPGLNLSPNDPHLLGGMFAVWNDKLGSVVSDLDVYERVKPAMPTLGEKMWSGTTAGTTYEQFQKLAANIGVAPGTSFPVISLPAPG